MIIHSILNEHVKILDFNPHFVSSSQQNSNRYVLYSTYCFHEYSMKLQSIGLVIKSTLSNPSKLSKALQQHKCMYIPSKIKASYISSSF